MLESLKKIFPSLFIIAFGFIMYYALQSNLSKCPRQEYLNEKFSGVVIEKFKNYTHKSMIELRVRTANDTHIFLHYDLPDFWDSVKTGDSVTKIAGSKYINLIRNSKVNSYSPFCNEK